MIKWFRNWRRRARRARTDAQYALLFHKVSNRLGRARSRARQLERENEYLRDQITDLRFELCDEAEKLGVHLAQQWTREVEAELEEVRRQLSNGRDLSVPADIGVRY